MILQRFGRALRRQDWFTVLVELMVVVVGIFLGLQVTDWNENRKARVDERLYLERLHDELIVATDRLIGRTETVAEWKAQCVDALEALNAGDLGDMSPEDFGWALVVVQNNSLVDAEITAIEELIAAGNLARISDLELSNRIARTHLTVESLGRFIELLADRTAALLPILHARFQPTIEGTSFDRVVYDFDALAADREFINVYANALNMLSTNEWWLQQAVDEFRTLRDAVGEAIEE
jgi:hypothetical protein